MFYNFKKLYGTDPKNKRVQADLARIENNVKA